MKKNYFILFFIFIHISCNKINGNKIISSNEFIYIPNFSSNTISIYNFNSINNSLNLINKSFSIGNNKQPSSIFVDPQKNYLYVTNWGSASISSFKIIENGSLSIYHDNNFSTLPLTNPHVIALSKNGKYAFVAHESEIGAISVWEIDQKNGKLKKVTSKIIGSLITWITTDISGNYIYATSRGTNQIFGFKFDENEKELIPITGSPYQNSQLGPYGIVFHPSNNILFINYLNSNTLCFYDFNNKTGEISNYNDEKSISTGEESNTRSLSISPNGKMIYLASSNLHKTMIYSFNIDKKSLDLYEHYSNKNIINPRYIMPDLNNKSIFILSDAGITLKSMLDNKETIGKTYETESLPLFSIIIKK